MEVRRLSEVNIKILTAVLVEVRVRPITKLPAGCQELARYYDVFVALNDTPLFVRKRFEKILRIFARRDFGGVSRTLILSLASR